ncbi:DUF998 domain-containing protein [Rhodococcus tibetensis]|uniref:DUF998 domain-containing protein n=1 Tax=Rhodococcus tibetensis TaxID=2965064 RepID=UPI00272E836D
MNIGSAHDARAVRVGGATWVLISLYFAAEVVTAAAWPRKYEVTTDSVSNLGAAGCDGSAAQLAVARICSPLHAVMNIAFVMTGVLIVVGAIGLREFLPAGRTRVTALGLLVLTAVSAALTGLVPINVDADLHQVVATPTFVARNAALAFLAVVLFERWRGFAVWTGSCCLVGVLGAIAIVIPGTSFGIAERLALYPFTIWVVSAGVAALVVSRGADQGRVEP